MKLRLIEFLGDIFIVIGIGYEAGFNPPDAYYAVPLKESLFRDVLLTTVVEKIPMTEAIEITDKNRIKAIMILYGS